MTDTIYLIVLAIPVGIALLSAIWWRWRGFEYLPWEKKDKK
jgi:hypothetical protein